MCGIVGVIGAITGTEERIFKQLLEVDSLRGRHSTGVIRVTSNGVVSTQKKAVDGMDFVKLYDKFITEGLNRALIGHNRFATRGAINDVNAHPFSHGHIHGVHNGTLDNQRDLKDNKDFDVDSDNMFYNMQQEGIVETAQKIRGAWTVAGYDENTEEFFMFRNDERPMAVAFSDDGRTMFFASEYAMLEWVLDRNGYKYKEVLTLTSSKLFKVPLVGKGKKQPPKVCEFTLEDLKYAPKLKPTVYGGTKTTTTPTGGYAKHGKKLSDWGLNGYDKYPVRIDSVEDVKGRNNNPKTVVKLTLMFPPFLKFEVDVYQPRTKAFIEGASKVEGENKGILQSGICLDYQTGEPKLYAVDLSKLTAKVEKIIQSPPTKPEEDSEVKNKGNVFIASSDGVVFDETGRCVIPKDGRWTDSEGKTYSDATYAISGAAEHGCCMCGHQFGKTDVIHWIGQTLGEGCCSDCVDDFEKLYGVK